MRSFSWTLGALREILGGTLSAGRGAANQILGRDANLIQKLQMGSEHYDPRIAYLLGFPMAGASSAPTCKIIASAMASSGHFAFFGQSPKCELTHTSFRLAPPKSGMTTSIWRQEGARLMQSGHQPTEAQIQGVVASNPGAISQIMAQRKGGHANSSLNFDGFHGRNPANGFWRYIVGWTARSCRKAGFGELYSRAARRYSQLC